MKKLITFVTCLTLFCAGMFAAPVENTLDNVDALEKYDKTKTTTETIIPENQHVTDKNATVKIEYEPMYDQARIYYETLYVTYDRGEAMNTVIAVLQDFQKERKYYSYHYIKDDTVKFYKDDRGQRKAVYSSKVKFTR